MRDAAPCDGVPRQHLAVPLLGSSNRGLDGQEPTRYAQRSPGNGGVGGAFRNGVTRPARGNDDPDIVRSQQQLPQSRANHVPNLGRPLPADHAHEMPGDRRLRGIMNTEGWLSSKPVPFRPIVPPGRLGGPAPHQVGGGDRVGRSVATWYRHVVLAGCGGGDHDANSITASASRLELLAPRRPASRAFTAFSRHISRSLPKPLPKRDPSIVEADDGGPDAVSRPDSSCHARSSRTPAAGPVMTRERRADALVCARPIMSARSSSRGSVPTRAVAQRARTPAAVR